MNQCIQKHFDVFPLWPAPPAGLFLCTKSEFASCNFNLLKGKPYGIIEETQAIEKNKIAIWVEDLGGIHQYVDESGNIYSTEDILQSVKQPRIIGKK